MELNKIGEVWNSANRLLSDFIGLLSSKSFANMAAWLLRRRQKEAHLACISPIYGVDTLYLC